MSDTQIEPEIIDTTSVSSDSEELNLSPEEVENIANYKLEAHPIEEEELEPEYDPTSLYREDNSPEKNLLFRIFAALIVAGTFAIAVLFIWSFWTKVSTTNIAQEQKKHLSDDIKIT